MNRPIIASVLLISLVTIFAFWAIEYFAIFDDNGLESDGTTILDQAQLSEQTRGVKSVGYKLEVFAENLFVPWSLVFTSTDRMLVAERGGQVRVLQNGDLVIKPILTLKDVVVEGEVGLLGMTLDPDYSQNRQIYLAYTYNANNELRLKVMRYLDTGNELTQPQLIIDNIPAHTVHSGGRLKFGPDGKLYLTTGDAGNKQLAQIKSSLAGKILRLNPDGSIPNDNPFPASPVYSLGHRNPQGLTWSIDGKDMYSTEHGPSVVDGPAGGDEVNYIQSGGNYGWPIVSHKESRSGLISPSITYTPAVAPASALIYTAEVFPQFKGNLLFGALKGEGIIRIIFSEKEPTKVIAYEKLEGVEVGRVRDVIQGPDGYIYFSSSNRDGRGDPQVNDDRIYRLVPE